MRSLLAKKPDLPLRELRAAVALECSLPAIHYALEKMGLTYKKDAAGLIEAIAAALESITPQNAGNWFAHCGYSFL
jgi:hypothetical protein